MTERVRVEAAMSEHPLATHAVGECVGRLLEECGAEPDLVVMAVTKPYLGALEDMVGAVRRLLSPRTTIGLGAESVLGGAREVESHGALSMFACWVDAPSAAPPVRPVRLVSEPRPGGPLLHGLDELAGAEGTLILFADPFSAPVDHVLERLGDLAPDLVVVGGIAAAAQRPGGNRLVLDAALHEDGMVGVLVSPEVAMHAVVSIGARAIGAPLTVTRAERHMVRELDGRPALEQLMEVIDGLDPADRALAADGLYLGRVLDEQAAGPGRRDQLVRKVLGADREIGAVAVADEVPLGATVQFHVRDEHSAGADLRRRLGDARPAIGALVFTGDGRGMSLFGVRHHDAGVIHEALGGAPVAGVFCAGELGPVGHTNFVHSGSASVLLVDPPDIA